MSANLSNALIITVLGMGLVFAAILLLWGVMALLVRIAPPPKPGELPKLDQRQPELERKRRAAIVAVAVALSQPADPHSPQLFPEPPKALVSAWQAVMRTKMLNKRGSPK